jgi:hypothetical protein
MSTNPPSSSDSARTRARQSQQQPQHPHTLIQQHQPFPSSTSSYSLRNSTSSSSLFGPNDSVKISFGPSSTSAGVNSFYNGSTPSSSFDRIPPSTTSSFSSRRPAFKTQSVVVGGSSTVSSSSSFFGAGGTGTRHGTISGAISTLTVPGGPGFLNGFTNGGSMRGNGNTNGHTTASAGRGSFRPPRAFTVHDALLRDSNSDLNSLYTIDNNTTPNRENGNYGHDNNDEDEDDDDEGGASYFGSSGQDFLLKKKRARMSRWLCWIDLLCLIGFTVVAGLQPPAVDNPETPTDWTWSWELIPVPLTAMAIVRILVIGFSTRYSHGNYNAVVIFICLVRAFRRRSLL